MSISVNFVERRDADTPSIERVFSTVADQLGSLGVTSSFTKARFGNDVISTLLNLIIFRPNSADIFHITGHINYMGLVLPKNRTILTIHDLTILDHRTGVRRWLIEKLYFTWPAHRLRYLTTVSHETKRRLLRLTGIADDKIRVIENPLLFSVSSVSGLRVFKESEPEILQLGTAANKNLERLFRSLVDIPCSLRIIGPLSPNLRDQLVDFKIRYSNSEALSDHEIERAYESSDLVTLCSTHEGFGLPIIEAQAKEVPVVTSDRQPMKDVAGGGAYLVDPESVESIRDGILAVIHDADLREDLVRRGRENVRRFEPSQVARKYRTLYEEVIANKTI